jgi:hypothetical protein
MVRFALRQVALIFTVALCAAAHAAAQSVLVDELASFKPPFTIVEGAVVQLADGSIYGLYTGGINGGIYRVSRDGAGGYITTLAHEFGEGQASPVPAPRVNGIVSDLMEAGPDGKIYFAGRGALVRFDPATGTAEELHAIPLQTPRSVIFGADGHTVFGATRDGQIYSYDTTTGDYRDLGNVGSDLTGLQRMNDGNLVAVHNQIFTTGNAVLNRIDPLTGAVTASIVRGRSGVLPPSRGDDGQTYVQLSDFGDRYTYRLEPSCFCLQTLYLIPGPNDSFSSTIAGARGGYLYINFAGNPHRLNLNVMPPTLERIATHGGFNYQLLPDGTLVMFTIEASVAIADAIDTGTIVPGSEATPVRFTRPLTNDGTAGFPDQWTEGPDGMLYGFASAHTRDGAVVRIDPISKARTVVAQVDFGPFDHTSGGVPSTRMVLAPDGRLYGTYTTWVNGFSAVFGFDTATNALEIVKTFPLDPNTFLPGPDGGYVTRVFVGSDGWLYGGTQLGHDEAAQYSGSFFKLDPASGAFVTLARPVLPNAFIAAGSMVEGAPGIWYVNYQTFTSGFCGGIGRLDTATGEFTELQTFDWQIDDPCEPDGLTRAADGTIYGIFKNGGPEAVPGEPGSRGAGGFFTLDPATGAVTTRHLFRQDGDVRFPRPDAIAAPDGMVYASFMTFEPDKQFRKGIVRFDPATGAATKVGELPLLQGFLSNGTGMMLSSDGRFYVGHQSPDKAFTVAVLDGIPVEPASGPFNGKTTISATLKAVGVPVRGRTIAFTLNGASIGSAITNDAGVATLHNVSLNGLVVGTYPNAVGASFAGDDHFPATSGSGSVTVVDVPTPGLVIGHGFIREDERKNEFAFVVAESVNGINRGAFAFERKSKHARDRFLAFAMTQVWFGDGVVMFAGNGSWNGQAGYRFEATAMQGAPGAKGSLRVTIYDASNTIIVMLDDVIDGGAILSPRL